VTVYHSPWPDVVIPDVALTGIVLAPAQTHPDRVALVDGSDGREFTYGDAHRIVHRMAGGFQVRGVRPGTVVALMAPNCPEYAFVFHAVAVAGGTLTTINPAYTAEEVRFQLLDSGASIIVVPAAFLPTARDAMEGTSVSDVIVIGDAEAGTTSLSEVDTDPIDQVPIDAATHVVVMPYSSGTTGLPKGVMLTHRNLVANVLQISDPLAFTDEDDRVALAVLPFFHIYGMQVLMNGLLANGKAIVTLPRFDLARVLELIQERAVTRFFVVPPIALAMAKHPVIDNYDLSSLRYVMSGAAPLGADVQEAAAARLGCVFSQGYGMTELSPVAFLSDLAHPAAGASGRAIPNTEGRLVDPQTLTDVPRGEVGELWIRGPQVMVGYLNNPEATNDMITPDGWLRTGDLAVVDADDNMTVVDRLKELIKVKGFQVAPAELEALLLTHPSIMDAAVIGVPDEEAGEVPKAFIVVRPGDDLSADHVQDFVSQHVATYKQVRVVEFVDSVPKSASGKILRRMLRDRT
jgi:4-coumarate--CoA ligase